MADVINREVIPKDNCCNKCDYCVVQCYSTYRVILTIISTIVLGGLIFGIYALIRTISDWTKYYIPLYVCLAFAIILLYITPLLFVKLVVNDPLCFKTRNTVYVLVATIVTVCLTIFFCISYSELKDDMSQYALMTTRILYWFVFTLLSFFSIISFFSFAFYKFEQWYYSTICDDEIQIDYHSTDV